MFPAKNTRCKAALTDGRKLSNAVVTPKGEIIGYIKEGSYKVQVSGVLGDFNSYATDMREFPAIDVNSVTWINERGIMVFPIV